MSKVEEAIKELQDEFMLRLQQLREQFETEPNHEHGWERIGDERYFIDDSIKVRSTFGFINEYMNELDENNALFSNQELAEDICFEQLVYRTLRKWRDTNDKDWKKLDWGNDKQRKFYITYDVKGTYIDYCDELIFKDINQIYFSSEQLVWRCIEENRELLTKYFNR